MPRKHGSKKKKNDGDEDGEVAGDNNDGSKKKKKDKYRKDKPWDNDSIDHWKTVSISQEDIGSKGLLTETSSFATLFPAYREQYLKQVWPDVKNVLAQHELKGDLNLVEGSMTVSTTKKTWDPYIIIKGRDMIKLLARSVPLPQAQKVLEDETMCDIMKIAGRVASKDRFVKRRQRLVGPNGSTLKAIELLTNCFVLVQGNTVCIMGSMKGLKQVRRIIEDCFNNIHPIYHIKELMIRRELEKDPELKDQNWDRFLPHFKKRNIKSKKRKIKKKENKDVFPPAQLPRKVDFQMETGEYFMDEQQRETKKRLERVEKQKAKTAERKREREKEFEPPADVSKPKKPKVEEESTKAMAERIKTKATQEKKKSAPKEASSLLL